jgi:hypothetical protein
MKGIRKLEEKCPEGLIFEERGKAVFEVGFIGIGKGIPLVGEIPVELSREPKIRIESGSLDPAPAHLGGWDPVKGVIELDSVKVLGEVSQGVELRPFGRRVNDSLPILVRPPCRADSNHFLTTEGTEPTAKETRTWVILQTS